MENLRKIGPTLPVYFRRQFLEHRKHKSPPTLRLRACCHFRHIRRKIGSVILKIGEQQLPMFKDGVVANIAVGNCVQDAGPNGPMVLKVFVSALWFQADHLTIALQIGEFSLSGRELVCNGQRQPLPLVDLWGSFNRTHLQMGILILRHGRAWRINANARLRRVNDYPGIDLCANQGPGGRRFGELEHLRFEEYPRRHSAREVPSRWKLAEIPGRWSDHKWILPQGVRGCRRRRSRLAECRRSCA